MREILRFKHLRERGILNNWPHLKKLVENEGFPEGHMLAPNTRFWWTDEIEEWLASRPAASQAKPPLKGGAKLRVEAKRAREAASNTAEA